MLDKDKIRAEIALFEKCMQENNCSAPQAARILKKNRTRYYSLKEQLGESPRLVKRTIVKNKPAAINKYTSLLKAHVLAINEIINLCEAENGSALN